MSNFHYSSSYVQSNSIFGRSTKFSRRIEREIDKLMGTYHVEVSIKSSRQEPLERITSLYVYDDKNRIINIVLPKSYPFHPPTLSIENKSTSEKIEYYHLYKRLSRFYIERLQELYSDHNSHICICCHNNIISNWSPNKNMLCVMKDNYAYEEWFKILKTTYYGKKMLIKQKIGIKDIIVYILKYIHEPVPST